MTFRALRILITAGGTREPIDDVRFVGNVSTGSTGAALAQALSSRGNAITLLRGEGSVAPSAEIESERFGSGADLWARLSRRLSNGSYDAVIMAAAVADYAPEAPVAGKIRSDADELVLRLTRTPKLLPQIKGASPAPVVVVGFKLTSRASQEERAAAVRLQWEKGGVDAVVHNDLAEIREQPEHPFNLHRSPACEPDRIHGAADLAVALEVLIRDRLGR